jgi:hypothetical protein
LVAKKVRTKAYNRAKQKLLNIHVCEFLFGWGGGISTKASSACLKNEQASFSSLRYADPPIRFAEAKLRGFKSLIAKIRTTLVVVFILALRFEPPVL